MIGTRVFASFVPAALGLQLVAHSPAHADEKRGLEVATKVDRAWSGYQGEEFEISLELINGNGDRVTRKMVGMMREGSDAEKMLMTIVWPADQKGTRLLTWGHANKDDDQWLYLPSIQRVKRISARGRSGSFLGSEFAYEDLVSPWEVNKYKYKFVREQDVGKHKTWVVERFPKDRDSGYSKQVVWFDKKYVAALRIDFYDRKGKLLKTSSFKDYKQYDGKWRANRIEVVNRQTGKKSNFIWTKRALGKSFSEDLFVPGALDQ